MWKKLWEPLAQIFRDFAQIFKDFAKILRTFARIFKESKHLGVRLHPLHPTSYTTAVNHPAAFVENAALALGQFVAFLMLARSSATANFIYSVYS